MPSTHLAEFLDRCEQRQLQVAVVGLGYVGLPLAIRCAQAGLSVLGLDVDEAKVQSLRAGRSYIRHIADERIQAANAQGFEATTDFSVIATVDVILICVPTPLSRHREPDMRFVFQTLESLRPQLRGGQLVVLESTSYPGTTEEEVWPRLSGKGLELGDNFFVGYSPEREDPGNPQFSTQTIPKLVSGITCSCQQACAAFYQCIVDEVVPVSSPRVAEMSKLMENIHRAVNIGLVNEMKIAADRMGIDIHEVIDAAATKPFGFVPYQPGPGLGGHCIPIDPFYLTWKAREYGVHTRFIELAGEINSSMPDWVMAKVALGLNRVGKPLHGSGVLVMGLAYKKNIDDLRHSPALELLEKLRESGARYAYLDPYVPSFPKLRDHSFDLKSEVWDAQRLASYDCIVLATDHDEFDYEFLREHAQLLIDTRGRYRGEFANVIKA